MKDNEIAGMVNELTQEVTKVLGVNYPQQLRAVISRVVNNCIKDLNLVEADQWVSVETDLPEADFEVLCCSGDDVNLCIFRLECDGSYYFDGMPGVTHWMPKPEPK